MRSRLCRACSDFHNLEEPWPVQCSSHFASRSEGSGPAIIPDGMNETLNPADGKRYDSRSAYYRAVKEAGCEIVGSDNSFREGSSPNKRINRAGEDIKRAMGL